MIPRLGLAGKEMTVGSRVDGRSPTHGMGCIATPGQEPCNPFRRVLAATRWHAGAFCIATQPCNPFVRRHRRPGPALKYALGLPPVSVVVVGIKSETELKQNLDWVKGYKPRTKEELDGLNGPTRELAKNWGEVDGQVV
jgi:hypothetical protein